LREREREREREGEGEHVGKEEKIDEHLRTINDIAPFSLVWK